jgi:hypothetical protein
MQDGSAAIKVLPDKSYMNKNPFYLPVTLDERTRNNLQEIQLYCKEDPNQPWVMKAKISPKQNYFNFKAPHDGEYWFTLVTVDKKGAASQLDETPNLIVHLDTQAPQIGMSALPECSDGKVVQVDVRDLNLDASKTQFLFQTGNKSWHRVEPMANTVNHYCIPRQAQLTGLVKVVAADLAGNSLVREFNLGSLPTVSTNVASRHNAPPTLDPLPPKSGPVVIESGPQEVVLVDTYPVTKPETPKSAPTRMLPAPSVTKKSGAPQSETVEVITQRTSDPIPPLTGDIKMVEEPGSSVGTRLIAQPSMEPARGPSLQPVSMNKQIVGHPHMYLDFQIDQLGPSGVGRMEIWLTKDQGQTWQKQGDTRPAKSPAEIDLPGEGLFGITLALSNGRGYGLTPPSAGDAPDCWVEVDLTKPAAEITSVRHAGPDDNALIITWTARDKNLTAMPIDLFFANDRKGPWYPIAKGLRNDGTYRWNVPGDLGPHAYIRLMATDQAGNVTTSESAQAVPLDDLSRPRARPLLITPGASPASLTPGVSPASPKASTQN